MVDNLASNTPLNLTVYLKSFEFINLNLRHVRIAESIMMSGR